MKFLSLLTVAASAVATPLAARAVPSSIEDAVDQVQGLGSGGDLVTLLQGALGSTTTNSNDISSILSKVDAGSITPSEGSDQLQDPVQGLQSTLTQLTGGLNSNNTGAPLPLSPEQLEQSLSVLKDLIEQLFSAAKDTSSISSAANNGEFVGTAFDPVFAVLATVIKKVVDTVGDVAPDVYNILTSILPGAADGDLIPLLSPITGLLTNLAKSQ